MNSLFAALLVLGLILVPRTHAIGLDLRVSPALGPWGNQVRISVIDFTPEETYDGFFSYNARFNYKWTNNSLHSVLVPSTPGTPQKFQIGNTSVVIDLPAVGSGIEGMLFGDPCVIHTSYYWPCLEGIGDRLPTLVNAALDATRPGRASALDFWTVLGDNFYDLLGDASHRVFDELTVQTKSVPLITVPGNHDYWVLGHPEFRTPLDQYGNGFMQFYGQDVMAGKSEAVNFLNFSISPHNEQCAAMSNFFQYKIIGNVGFIGYSSRYTWEEQLPYFEEACSYFGEQKPTWLVLYGHWNKDDAGAAPGMDVPTVQSQVKLINGCNITTGLKGFMGHTHCNQIVTPGEVFMVGGSGFPHNQDEPGCDMAGFVYLRTTETSMELIMFDYTKAEDYFAVLSCVGAHGIGGCTQMGTVWLNQTVTPAAQSQAAKINA